MNNQQVAELFDRIALLLEASGGERFKVIAYRKAATSILNLNEAIEKVWKDGRLEDIPYVGKAIAEKTAEYLSTGHLAYLENLEKTVPEGAVELMAIPGIGPRTAYKLATSGVKTVEQLQMDFAAGKTYGLSPLISKKILEEMGKLQASSKRMLLSEASLLASTLVGYFASHGVQVEVAGSLRRGKETVGDFDLLSMDERANELLTKFPGSRLIEQGKTRTSIRLESGTQVDLRVVEKESFGAALLYFTGSKEHNIVLRSLAIEKGWSLNEYSLHDSKTDKYVAGRTETAIYAKLGLRYIEPELREDRGEVEAARLGKLPTLVEQSELRGDLQMHSDWSDGKETMEAMAGAAKKMGYEYIAFTDHSVSLRVANGLSEERFRQQWKAIDDLNEKMTPFRILKGVEAESKSDGTLDYRKEFLDGFDIVGASIHQGFNQSPEKLTERALKILSNPSVDFLCHPTNRLIGKREGHALDLWKVIKAAKDNGKMLEIDAQPDRLDLDDVWSRRAKDEGVKLLIDADAHSVLELENIALGVTVARRGWLESKDVANTEHLDGLLRLLR